MEKNNLHFACTSLEKRDLQKKKKKKIEERGNKKIQYTIERQNESMSERSVDGKWGQRPEVGVLYLPPGQCWRDIAACHIINHREIERKQERKCGGRKMGDSDPRCAVFIFRAMLAWYCTLVELESACPTLKKDRKKNWRKKEKRGFTATNNRWIKY